MSDYPPIIPAASPYGEAILDLQRRTGAAAGMTAGQIHKPVGGGSEPAPDVDVPYFWRKSAMISNPIGSPLDVVTSTAKLADFDEQHDPSIVFTPPKEPRTRVVLDVTSMVRVSDRLNDSSSWPDTPPYVWGGITADCLDAPPVNTEALPPVEKTGASVGSVMFYPSRDWQGDPNIQPACWVVSTRTVHSMNTGTLYPGFTFVARGRRTFLQNKRRSGQPWEAPPVVWLWTSLTVTLTPTIKPHH